MNLRELDARVIPDLARRTQDLAGRVRRVRHAGQERVAVLRPAPAVPSGLPAGPAPTILRLRALDSRYAARGPLALVRDIPQLGVLLIALLIALNAAVFMQRSDRTDELVSSTPDGAPAPVIPGGGADGSVGPEIGDDVAEYVQEADRELQERFDRDRDARSIAIVSFDEYVAPEVALELLAPLNHRGAFRAFFRVPGDLATEPHATPVKNLVGDIRAAYEEIAASRRVDIRNLLGEAKDADPAQKAYNEATARQYAREAAELESGCACVFALAVYAPNKQLVALRKQSGIRVVDLAPPDAARDVLVFTGLRPEETVTVTNGNQKPE